MLTIEPLEDVARDPAGLPVIPWVREEDAAWLSEPPLAELSDPRTTTRATVRAAVTVHDLQIHIQIRSAHHANHNTGGAIWDGDAVQLGINAYPPSAEGFAPEVSFTTPFSAAYSVALTDRGPEIFAHYHGREGGTGPRPDLMASPSAITRDESRGVTTYHLVFPWSEFGSAAGISPTLALAVQVNDKHPQLGEVRMFYGDGAGGAIKPGKFRTVRVGSAPEGVAVTAACATERWVLAAGDASVITVATNAQEALTIIGSVEIGAHVIREERRVPAAEGKARGIRRFAVRWRPETVPETLARHSLAVIGPEREVRAQAAANIASPRMKLSALEGLLDLHAGHEARRAHGEAVMRVVRSELAMARDRLGLIECLGYIDRLIKQARSDQGPGSDMIRTIRPRESGAEQPYRLSIPAKQTNAGHPLVVYLHGSGNPHTLSFLLGSEASRTAREAVPEAFILEPWARGNAWYKDAAGQDVWDAIADVLASFRVDRSRVYLTGHSMGGYGTYRLALERPEMFAAIAICSGAKLEEFREDPRNAYLAMPIKLWHGGDDAIAPPDNVAVARAALEAAGHRPEIEIVPGHGHSMTSAQQAAIFRWLVAQPARR